LSPLPSGSDTAGQLSVTVDWVALVLTSVGLAGAVRSAQTAVPLPEWGTAAAAAGEAIGNALDAGARGDGATDDTAALQAALDAHRFLFIPFGIYVVSDTLRLRADALKRFDELAAAFGLDPEAAAAVKKNAGGMPADDVQVADIEVVDRVTQVLLMAGGPGREYQFMRNVLHRDKSFVVDVTLGTASSGISRALRA
jgi:hypothetical protein